MPSRRSNNAVREIAVRKYGDDLLIGLLTPERRTTRRGPRTGSAIESWRRLVLVTMSRHRVELTLLPARHLGTVTGPGPVTSVGLLAWQEHRPELPGHVPGQQFRLSRLSRRGRGWASRLSLSVDPLVRD
jgi:hypothetical protein